MSHNVTLKLHYSVFHGLVDALRHAIERSVDLNINEQDSYGISDSTHAYIIFRKYSVTSRTDDRK